MRVTIAEAAKRLGLPTQSLRLWIQSNQCPFGEVIIDRKKKGGHRTYYINEQRLNAYLRGNE